MTDLTDEALDALVARLHDDGLGFGIGPALLSQSAAAVITALRQREAEAVAGAIEAAAQRCADLYRSALNDSDADLLSDWKSHKASAYGTALQAIRAMNTDATRAALDKVRAEGMREAAGIAQSAETPVFKDGWSAGQDAAAISTMGSISRAILAAAVKLEGK